MEGQVGSSLQEVRPGSVLVRPLDSVLQFPRVQTEDAAHYVCVVNNGLGEDRRELVLTVATPLLVHIRPQHQVNNDFLLIACFISYYPQRCRNNIGLAAESNI